jgi:F-type H+-transporting ATPase subunit delta
MSRSYAKAAFEFANELNVLIDWRLFLNKAALISQNKRVQKVWLNPLADKNKIVDLFAKVCSQLPVGAENFLHILALKKRLIALPRILELFEQFYALQEKNVTVEVSTASIATDNQKKIIEQALIRYFKQDMVLTFVTDETVLAGFIARAGDLVIDASVQQSLKELERKLI